ncbi:fibronectin type III domain-containing protein [bacterium]|nr:fibronectin type III domain-containing protein [candidate division CSSED10-310 bacterium]
MQTSGYRQAFRILIIVMLWAATPAGSLGVEPEDAGTGLPVIPPMNLVAADTPNDNGNGITLRWDCPPGDDGSGAVISGYVVLRSENSREGYLETAVLGPGTAKYIDNGPAADPVTGEKIHFIRNKPYYYRVAARYASGYRAVSGASGPVQGRAQWFHDGKIPVLTATVLFFALVILYIQKARLQGSELYVRPIAGMKEIDNAIGRATEMGRPILYVLGLGSPEDIATIASYTILARVARKTAEYRTELIVPCNEPIVMTIAQETVRNAYMEAGHPDAYSDDMVFFVTSMQFAYVAAVNGLMLREKTATNCYFGKFYAESLLLSETGNIAGSIQVAGTDEVAQLPFFVTTCDYTLIGEELYAASAYLGRDPLLLGALKAQDFAKALVMILIVAGAVLMSFGIDWLLEIITVRM